MTLSWDDFRSALAGARLPALVVDVDALDRNVDRVAARVRASGKTCRPGTKSIRSVALTRRVLERGGDVFRGLLTYSYDEAAMLAEAGLDDLLVAYPSVQAAALDALASHAASGKTARFMADSIDHLEAISAAGARAKATLDVVVDIDVAYRPLGRAHLGVVRSSLRDRASLVSLLSRARRTPHLRVVGLMGYEAHVAGLPDTGANAAFKALAWPAVVARRRESVLALRSAGVVGALVNGGGTGSLSRTLSDPSVTEATVGSGFLCSHLFDSIGDLELEPAIFVALEVVRIPDAGHVTASGGGYVASGAPARDRLLRPMLPAGMTLLEREGAGEVQTPLDISRAERAPRVGDPVILRPAKAGEIAERFHEHLWISGGRLVGRSPTYRGEGHTFF